MAHHRRSKLVAKLRTYYRVLRRTRRRSVHASRNLSRAPAASLRNGCVIGSAALVTGRVCRQVRQQPGSGEGPGTGPGAARLPDAAREMVVSGGRPPLAGVLRAGRSSSPVCGCRPGRCRQAHLTASRGTLGGASPSARSWQVGISGGTCGYRPRICPSVRARHCPASRSRSAGSARRRHSASRPRSSWSRCTAQAARAARAAARAMCGWYLPILASTSRYAVGGL
jgi:hypothetical protein